MHPAALSDDDLLKQCAFERSRAGGPGGQHRNKVETMVALTHEPTGARAHASERRSQSENKRVALFRLRLALATNHREPVPRGEIGSERWRSRVRNGRIACNTEHHDFPALLAEALDALADAEWDAAHAALRLNVTTTQLVRFVRGHPPAFETLNRERERRGLRPFK